MSITTKITRERISNITEELHRLLQVDVIGSSHGSNENITNALKEHNTNLDGLSLLLATLVTLNRGDLRPLYFDYGAGKTLTRSIVEAFIKGITRFPGQYTSKLQHVCLYFLSKLVPRPVDYYGSDQEAHTAYALLVAKVLNITTSDLQAALKEASMLEELDRDALSEAESLEQKFKLRTIRKRVWFYAADMYVHAVVFLASYPDIRGIVSAYGGSETNFHRLSLQWLVKKPIRKVEAGKSLS